MNVLPVPTADDRAAWASVNGVGILARAEADLGTPWPQPLASQAARVRRDGDRASWENLAFERQHRLSRAVIAAALTLNERWIDEVIDGVQLLCEQSSWCWPAHDDAFERRGEVLATVSAPFLDLGASEVAGQLAWTDHILGTQFDARTPGIRNRIRHETEARVLRPFQERRDWHWLGLDGDVHNWNPWIHSNILASAVQLREDPTEIIDLVVEGLRLYIDALPADGAIDEGYSYWWNGACRALEALDLLELTTGLSPFDTPSLRETVAFPHRCHLGGAWYANLADAQARPPAHQPWHALHRAALRWGNTDAARHAAAHRDLAPCETSGLGRLARELTDPAWNATPPAHSPLPRDVWLASTEVLLARQCEGSAAGLTLVAKGGHNGEHHNHNDVGSFIVASDGVPVIVDAGRPSYTAATFGPDRYSIWTMQSGWHNTPTIAGVDQCAGREFAASVVEIATANDLSSLAIEIAGAYPIAGVCWRRTAALDRRRGLVRIADTWSGPAAGSRLNVVIAGEISLIANGARITPLEGATPVVIRWPAGIRVSLTVRVLDDPMLNEVWGERLTRLELDVGEREDAWITIEADNVAAQASHSEDER
ncbi:MAG: heparinase II/III family protein [Microbacterium sp.]